MAFRNLGGSPKKALPGELLLVVHDFEARSSDELSLLKGDRIELIERDDDFGDGWYLGKHIQNGKTGLFPEVYTTAAPRAINVGATTMAMAAHLVSGTSSNFVAMDVTRPDDSKRGPTNLPPRTSTEPINSDGATPPPLNTTPPSQKTASTPNTSLGAQVLSSFTPAQRTISMVQQAPDEDSPVMNETLSVIDEHITDMNMPRSNIARGGERRLTNDSGSEYSTHIDHRLSYITGQETDEEERNLHSEKEVLTWSPEQVAENLEDIGVESRHCEIFKEQEITGEVLLAMDQASIFMKEFDLGLVGRRLRTWHKIKALQEEVRGSGAPLKKGHRKRSGDAFPENRDFAQKEDGEIKLSSVAASIFNQPSTGSTYLGQDVPSPQRSPSAHTPQSLRHDPTSTPASFTFKSGFDSPSRPSAASIRDLNHSRRHSAIDVASTFRPYTPEPIPPSTPNNTSSPHKKTPSLDRNWTMGGPHSVNNGRPRSATSTTLFPRTDRNTFDPHSQESRQIPTLPQDLDPGYVSGGEMDSKKARNVLRKRDTISANHSRQSSYQADTKRLSFAAARRHSRFGSVDSIKDTVAAMASPAAKMYHGSSIMGHFRNSSANEAVMPSAPTNDLTSPTVTKLEYSKKPSMKIVTSATGHSKRVGSNGSPKSGTASSQSVLKPRMGLRAISDAVTGHERVLASSPASAPSPIKETAVQSPTRTGSTTPSGASQSIELESTDASSKGTTGAHTSLTPTSGTRRKPKKETSAYTRGLEQKPPQEQMDGCDYSGWMKKKSANVMTTWKPRLFVLRGRRLSYYYSESDLQEKGLIDISSHRVLPADHDLFTGFHATVTGAKSSPVSPATAHTPTLASKEAGSQPESTVQKPNPQSMFIFKLVPPRTGLSRAVNFTKPTVHYFAVDNVTQGRLWMAALMKATIDRDETKPITTTYQQKTISLVKARAMRHRPPALMGLDEKKDAVEDGAKSDETGLNIQGFDFDKKGEQLEHKRTGSLDDTPSIMHSKKESVKVDEGA